MRIMFAITKGEVGGAQEHLRILAQGLLERGNHVALVVTPGSELAESVQSLGATIFAWQSISANAAPLSNLSARRELRAAVMKWNPDVLHLYSSVAGAVGCRILRPPRGITIFTCHHAPFGRGRTWKNRVLSRPVAHATLPRMDGIITDGNRDLPALRRIAKHVPFAVVRNAVPTLGPPKSDGRLAPSAIWVARLAHPKDPLMAVSAWERVVARTPEATLTICGSGPLGDALKARVQRSPARSNIEIAGFVPDTSAFVKRASIFLLISKVEGGTTMATLEAMSEGLVPVITDVGESELLTSNKCGVVVESYDPDSIADSVVGLVSDPERYSLLRANALRFARERTIDDFVDETFDFYRRVQDHASVRVA
jgi:glycosyltransferase involved in cell wall biosynthesis